MFSRLSNAECSDELFELVPLLRFQHRTSRLRTRAHLHIGEAWRTNTTRASRFTSYRFEDPELFPLHGVLKDWQRVGSSSVDADVHEQRHPSPNECFVCSLASFLTTKKKEKKYNKLHFFHCLWPTCVLVHRRKTDECPFFPLSSSRYHLCFPSATHFAHDYIILASSHKHARRVTKASTVP